MNIDNLFWWLILLWNVTAFCLYGFGRISRGNLNTIIEFIGGVSILLSFVAMLILKGVVSGVVFIILSLLIVAPLTGFIMAWLKKKLYGHYLEGRQPQPVSKQEQTKSWKPSEDEKDKLLLRALSRGMVKAHLDHKDEHPELQAYSSFEDWLKENEHEKDKREESK